MRLRLKSTSSHAGSQRCFWNACVEMTSPGRILFPKSGITKKDLIDYYERIAPIMIPYMKNRLLTMQRFPEGIDQEGFFHKNVPEYFPEWIKRVPVEKKEGGIVNYMVCNNTASLVYLANAACITPHLFLSKIDKLHYPDHMIFDLDPQKKDDFSSVKKVAKRLKVFLEELGLIPFVKTTGSRGLHVVVPLDRKLEYEAVRTCALRIAAHIVYVEPRATIEVRKTQREGKVFIDTLRNAFTATAVAPYAVRPHPGAPVATPIHWEDLEMSRLISQSYNIANIFERVDQEGDAWKGMQAAARSLKKVIKLLSQDPIK